MKMNSYLLELGLVGLLLGSLPAYPEVFNSEINWNCLNLTNTQKNQIRTLDKQWRAINATVRPELTRNQNMFKLLITDPKTTDDKIRETYWKILLQQQQIKYEALETFLAKRRLMNTSQRKKLHQMIVK